MKEGALPSQTNAEMERDSKGTLATSLSLRAQAVAERHERTLLAEVERQRQLEAEIRNLRLRIVALEAEVRGRDGRMVGNDFELGQGKRRNGTNHTS